jgi:hypothetical protein
VHAEARAGNDSQGQRHNGLAAPASGRVEFVDYSVAPLDLP